MADATWMKIFIGAIVTTQIAMIGAMMRHEGELADLRGEIRIMRYQLEHKEKP